jgi:hypothetical protein
MHVNAPFFGELADVVMKTPLVLVVPDTVAAKPALVGEDDQATVMLPPLTAVPFEKYVWTCATHAILPFVFVQVLMEIMGLIVGRGGGLGEGAAGDGLYSSKRQTERRVTNWGKWDETILFCSQITNQVQQHLHHGDSSSSSSCRLSGPPVKSRWPTAMAV